jgi:hypothetical protein
LWENTLEFNSDFTFIFKNSFIRFLLKVSILFTRIYENETIKRNSIIKKNSIPEGSLQNKQLSVKKKDSTEVHDNELIANNYYKNQNTDNLDQNQNETEIKSEPDIDLADNPRDSRDNNIGFKNSAPDNVDDNPPDADQPDDNPLDPNPPDDNPPDDNPPDDNPPDDNPPDRNSRGSGTQSEREKDNKSDENNGKKSNNLKKEKIAPIETTKQNQENQKPEFNPKLREDSIVPDEKKIPEKRKGFISRAVASVKNLFNFTKKDATGKLKHF